MERHGGLDADGVTVLLALMSADSPAQHVRIVLAYHRRQGRSFDDAWASALRSIPRKAAGVPEWRTVLRFTRERWRAAYGDDEAAARETVGDGFDRGDDGHPSAVVGPGG